MSNPINFTQLAAACLPSSASRQTSSEPEPSVASSIPSRARQPSARIEILWARLAAIYGHRWTSAYGDDPAGLGGDTWGVGLFGVTPAELAAGIQACILRNDSWPPTLPEFRALCFGIPSLAAVKLDLPKAHRQPFTCLVALHLDFYALARMDQGQADRALRDAYEIARELRMAGAPLPEPVAALTADPLPAPRPKDPAVARRVLDDLGTFLWVAPPGVSIDDLVHTIPAVPTEPSRAPTRFDDLDDFGQVQS